jgi:serine/threonine-protein kinase HipA
MARKAEVYLYNFFAGILSEDENGYDFQYAEKYLQSGNPIAVSFLLPLRKEKYHDRTIFPFFDGLIPEGWLLDIAEKNWKLDPSDRMGLLLACCRDCIGAVSIREVVK